ncbi:hypothetical protein HOI26_06170 [Candidatus Woesearchaeota archaeon]|jgi:hypothetical protein|nr:hypothetical protein [Candidatus Woesearchaeota archaeon]MBT5740654.1 hypothetical protein [Candidatus Woesearchaeota archaeon]MBT6402504.1 hypothetical protein [Candidatus Woesearchaeota archaeon]
MVRLFEEYLEDGIVKTKSPEFSRATSLEKEARKSITILQEFIEKIGIQDNNANYIIKNVYDIIMELIRAKMFREGFSSVGKGAHEAEVAYLQKLGFKDIDVEFVNQLRFFRNGILYYGKSFDKEYAKKVVEFLNEKF